MEEIARFLGLGAATAASGGLGLVLGLAGSIVTSVTKWLQQKQQNAFQEKQWQHEKDLLKLNMEARSQETENEAKLLAVQGSYAGLTASIEADAMVPTGKFVGGIVKLVRPLMTFLLIGFCVYIFMQVMDMRTQLAQILGQEMAFTLVRSMINDAFLIMSTAVAWWFGDRGIASVNRK